MDSPAGNARRLVHTLERLLQLPPASLPNTLADATDVMAEALGADKVDAFFYDAARDSLVALGTSNQPLSAMQRRHGLDVLPLANGGRAVQAYTTGATFVTGRADNDPEELRGIKETLAVRSTIAVPLVVGTMTRGVLLIASLTPDRFGDDDVRFTEIAGRWIGLVAHRTELIERIAADAVERARHATAEELVTVVAHDLRNYLAPLDLRLYLISQRAEAAQRQDDVRDLGLARKGIGRVVTLVNDILDVSRIDRGTFATEREDVDIIRCLEDIAQTLGTPEHPVSVIASGPTTVPADPARLRQCLENLVSNAIRHSPERVPVIVRVSREPGSPDDWAVIRVIDQGPGVSSEMLPRIFDRFATSHGREGGMGLGLYLAKRIANIHGGELTVQSQPGRGACFALRLPCAKAG